MRPVPGREDPRRWLTLVLGGMLAISSSAGAQEAAPMGGPDASDREPPVGLASTHSLSAYFTSGGQVYLSAARTMGGLGGGLGVRDTLSDRFIFQADVRYLAIIRNVVAARAAAGIQWRWGAYDPALLLTVSVLFGDRFSFLTALHPVPVAGPAAALGLVVAPLRFRSGGLQASALELGAGLGTDLPGLGASLYVGLLDVGASF